MQDVHPRRSIEGIRSSGEYSQLEGELQVSRSDALLMLAALDQERRRDSEASDCRVIACMTMYM
jgi:hypothetical protein